MRISKSGKLVFPEKSGFCGKSSTPAHVRFFPKPFISFASAQLRLRWHSPCARRLQQEVADRNALLPIHSHLPRLRRFGGFATFLLMAQPPLLCEEGNTQACYTVPLVFVVCRDRFVAFA